jgi:hypothetical protein
MAGFSRTGLASAVFATALGLASAQEPTPTPAAPGEAAPDTEKDEKPQIPFRPIESNVIVNLPSVDVPPDGP